MDEEIKLKTCTFIVIPHMLVCIDSYILCIGVKKAVFTHMDKVFTEPMASRSIFVSENVGAYIVQRCSMSVCCLMLCIFTVKRGLYQSTV